MTEADLYVIAAGNGSRMNSSLPKPLIQIVDEPCLTTTLRRISGFFRRTFIVTNVLSHELWRDYFDGLYTTQHDMVDRVREVPIRSGLGDGHATMHGILEAKKLFGGSLLNDIVIVWGDVFFTEGELIKEILSCDLVGAGLIPAVLEDDPYVCLRADDLMRCMSADFSKYGERHAFGLHDQSVFRFNLPRLMRALQNLHKCLWKNDRYLSPGGELSLLHSFHELYNSGDAAYVYETKYTTASFNTRQELMELRKDATEPKMVPS